MYNCCVPNCSNNASFRFPAGDLQHYNAWIKAVNNPNLINMSREKVVMGHRVCLNHFSTAQFVPIQVDHQSVLKDTAIPDCNLVGAHTDKPVGPAADIALKSHGKNSRDVVQRVIPIEPAKVRTCTPRILRTKVCKPVLPPVVINSNFGSQKVLVMQSKIKHAYSRCCIPGCANSPEDVFLQPFPKESDEPERYRKWLAVIGCQKLKTLSSAEVFENYCVCHTHFSEDQMTLFCGKWKCLNHDAVPNRNLPLNVEKRVKCVICKTLIVPQQDKAWDIERETIGKQHIRLHEFISKSIFRLYKGELIFDGTFACHTCYVLCVKVEDCLTKSNSLQEVIINRYLRAEDVPNANETKEMEIKTDASNFEEFVYDSCLNTPATKSIPLQQIQTNKIKSPEVASAKTRELVAFGLQPRDMKGPFCCEICGKSFGSKQVFKLHLRLHKNQNLFPCSYCDKRFTQKAGLARHMVKHTGEKPHKCHVCNKSFTYESSIKVHYDLVHSGERKFACTICDKKFVFKQHLKRHLTSHTGLKAFECSACNATFAYKYNMMMHMKKHKHDAK